MHYKDLKKIDKNIEWLKYWSTRSTKISYTYDDETKKRTMKSEKKDDKFAKTNRFASIKNHIPISWYPYMVNLKRY